MDVTVRMELDKLEEVRPGSSAFEHVSVTCIILCLQAIKDLAFTHKDEIRKAGARMTPEMRETRKEVCGRCRCRSRRCTKCCSTPLPPQIMASVVRSYQEAYKHAKGYAHHDAEESIQVSRDGCMIIWLPWPTYPAVPWPQSGIGISSLTAEQLASGEFPGAGVKTRREELSGEHMQVRPCI